MDPPESPPEHSAPGADGTASGAGAPAAPPRPHLVFYEVTRRCPLACVHCRARAQTEALPGELSTSSAVRWIEGLAAFGTPPVLVLTGGDPLSRPDLFELVRAARDRGLPVAVSPAVSAALTPAVLGRLAREEVSAISLSLDGALAATHEAVRRQPGVFDATVRAFREAVAAGLRVQMNTAVLRSNLSELPRLFGLVRDLGLSAWEVFFLVRTGRAETLEDLVPAEYEAVAQFLYDASRHGVAVRPIEAPFVRRILRERRRGPPEGLSAGYAKLSSDLEAIVGAPTGPSTLRPHGPLDGDGTIFVRYDGAVFPGGFAEYPLGNVQSTPLATIYRDHPALARIRRREFHGPCGVCPYRGCCGGSRGRAYAVGQDLFGSDPACAFAPQLLGTAGSGATSPPRLSGPGPGA